MSNSARSLLGYTILGLLAALVATNVAFLLLQRTGGPLIGLAFYGVLLVQAWRAQRRGYRGIVVGGLVGLIVHVVELITIGWSAYPMLMSLNLVLPATLALVAWAAGQGPQKMAGNR
jgi:hypothetical protein